ncbi:MAG: hypothetical protein NTX03_06350 [Bacteroidetes bacterium]|nr:hypothetical protein [Bacteroidota bacterium]
MQNLTKTFFLCFLLLLPFISKAQIAFIVNQDTITQQEILLRKKINAAQLGVDSSSVIAAYQLIKAAAYREIAMANKFPLTDKILLQEVARIDATTQMPDRIIALRKLCKTEKDYQHYYVLPDFSERWLYYNFSNNAYIHHYSKGVFIQHTLDSVVKSKIRFEELAKKYHSKIDTIQLDSRGQLILHSQKSKDSSSMQIIDLSRKAPVGINDKMSQQMQQKDSALYAQLFNDVVKDLKVNTIHPKVIFMPESFWVARLVKLENGIYTLQYIAIPKISFNAWLKTQTPSIHIKVYDKKLWGKTKENFGSEWSW